MSIANPERVGNTPGIGALLREAGLLRRQLRDLQEEYETVRRETAGKLELVDWLTRAHDAGYDLARLSVALECVAFKGVHYGQTLSDLNRHIEAMATEGKFGTCHGGRGGSVACVWTLKGRATDAQVDGVIYLLTLLRDKRLPWPCEGVPPVETRDGEQEAAEAREAVAA